MNKNFSRMKPTGVGELFHDSEDMLKTDQCKLFDLKNGKMKDLKK